MVNIQNLEIHLAHGCNLACESCSHYSNQGHKGIVSLEDAERWMRAWNGLLRPATFSLLGGEPTLHPRLTEAVLLARQCWPEAHLRLVTNGFFLHRHPGLVRALRDGNSSLCLSIHHSSPEYNARLAPIRALVEGWRRRHGIQLIYYESYRNWTRRYKGTGADMAPYDDGQPRRSWENCPGRHCKQLFEGKLWKCAPLAYLGLQDAKYGLSAKWKPYLAYQPLSPECTDAELREFCGREEEFSCSMCTAYPERFALPMPLRGSAAVGERAVPPASPARKPLQMVSDWLRSAFSNSH